MRETVLHLEEEIAAVEREYFAILDKIAELVREKEVFERSWSQVPAFLDDAKKLDWYGKSWEYKDLKPILIRSSGNGSKKRNRSGGDMASSKMTYSDWSIRKGL